MVVAVLAIILTLILVVGLHEAGHALVARLFLIKIKRISIGFGKPLLQWSSKNGCEWVWGMWPLGGYVQLLNTRIAPVKSQNYSQCFDKKPVWKRILVLLAGSLANFVLAWMFFSIVFLIGMQDKPPEIQSITKNSRAAQAGMMSGDQFVSINGTPTPSWREVGMKLVELWGKKEVTITVKRSENDLKKFILNLDKINFGEKKQSLLSSIGIAPNAKAITKKAPKLTISAAMTQANATIIQWLYFFLMVLKQLIIGAIPFSVLLGPIGLFAVSITSLSQGIVVFMFFIASLSTAVALVNLFPIPGLDGGSILYALIEKIRGKPLSVAMELLLYRLVVIVFALLLVHLLMNDLQRFYS